MTKTEQLTQLEKSNKKKRTWIIIIAIIALLLFITSGILTFSFLVSKDAYKKQVNKTNNAESYIKYLESTRTTDSLRIENKVETKYTKKTIDYANYKMAQDTLKLVDTTTPDVAILLWTDYMEQYLPANKSMVSTEVLSK